LAERGNVPSVKDSGNGSAFGLVNPKAVDSLKIQDLPYGGWKA
jgi:hypothetical protein